MQKETARAPLFLLFLLCFFLFLRFPAAVAVELNQITELILQVFFPRVFPFLLYGAFLSELASGLSVPLPLERACTRLFGLRPPALLALFVGLLCGYPAGSRAVERCVRSRDVSPQTARRLILFCTAPPISFCTVVLGGVLGDATLGVLSYLSILCACLVFGALLCKVPRQKQADYAPLPPPFAPTVTVSDCLLRATKGSVSAFGVFCALYVAFRLIYALLSMLTPHGLQDECALFYGLLDAAGGCCTITLQNQDLQHHVSTALLAFGGVSALLQLHPMLTRLRVKVSRFLLARLFICALSCIFLYFFRKFF